MNLKYFEYIVIYLSVLLVCVIVGALARISFLGKGGDEYTANIVFWSITALSILIYAIIILFLDGIIVGFRKILRKNRSSENNNAKSNVVKENLDKIREDRQYEIKAKEKDKRDNAVGYIQEQFAPYTSNEHLNLLCDYVILYSQKQQLENVKLIKIEKLSNLDLYHFGWNIWKHFNVCNQSETAVFLKTVFSESLKEVESESIKRHLKDDEMKGIITIKESLSD